MKRTIESISLGILFVVVALRPLVAESYDSASNPMTTALQSVSDPSPVRTLFFDLAILISAMGWLVARAVGTLQRYRKTGLEWGTLILFIAATASCLFAGQKRLAINGTIDWLCYPLLTIVLVQLLRRRWQRQVLIAVIVGTACVQAVQCFDQYFVGFDSTWSHYREIMDEFWARQGVELDSAKVELFEHRILARESSGFLPHSNLTGSYLMLGAFVALGVTISGFRRSRGLKGVIAPVGCAIVTAGILAAVLTTKSTGAVVSGAVGLVVGLLIRLARRWIDSNRKRALLVGWGLAAIGLLSTAGYGLIFDRLPHMSMTFRWQYWKASTQLIADHPLTGVGRENFGRHYLQYKTIDSPEEVSNPHNLFVQTASDWGLVGLAGLIVAMAGVSLTLTHRLSDRMETDDPVRKVRVSNPGIMWGAFILVALSLCRLPLLGAADSEFFAYAYYTTVVAGVVWIAGYLFAITTGIGSSPTESNRGPLLGLAGGIAILTFLVHDLINFALFTPACATTFFAVLAVCLSERIPVEKTSAGDAGFKRWIWPAASGILTAAVFFLFILPAMNAQSSLARARAVQDRMTPGSVYSQLALTHYQRAASVDAFDSTAMTQCAEWLFRLSAVPAYRDEALTLAMEYANSAQARDPYSVRPPRLLARLYLARAASTVSSEDYLAAIDAANAALRLYPEDPGGMVMLADCLARVGYTLDDADMSRRAAATYKKALGLDAARPEWERIRRFRSHQREAIQHKITFIENSISVP